MRLPPSVQRSRWLNQSSVAWASIILFLAMNVAMMLFRIPVVLEFMETGLVPRFPTAILSASIMVLAVLSLITGIILDSVARGRRELKRLHYLSMTWLGQSRRGMPREIR